MCTPCEQPRRDSTVTPSVFSDFSFVVEHFCGRQWCCNLYVIVVFTQGRWRRRCYLSWCPDGRFFVTVGPVLKDFSPLPFSYSYLFFIFKSGGSFLLSFVLSYLVFSPVWLKDCSLLKFFYSYASAWRQHQKGENEWKPKGEKRRRLRRETTMNETHWAAKEKETGIEVRPTDSFIIFTVLFFMY